MSINQDDLNKLSCLAKIDIAPDQIDKISDSLNNILGMVAQIQAADTMNVAPLANPLDAEQILRRDQITEKDQREQLLALAPETEQGLFLVPQVIE